MRLALPDVAFDQVDHVEPVSRRLNVEGHFSHELRAIQSMHGSRLLDDALDPGFLPEAGRRRRHPVYLVETELGEPGAEVTVTFVWVPAA